jgi:hypothetical protein
MSLAKGRSGSFRLVATDRCFHARRSRASPARIAAKRQQIAGLGVKAVSDQLEARSCRSPDAVIVIAMSSISMARCPNS